MYKYELDSSCLLRDKDGNLDSTKYMYGSRFRDQYLLHDNASLPLYGALARKALMHYARDHYNPHTICISHEPFIREIIKEFVQYKITNRIKDYDWEFIDHFLRRFIENYYHLEPTYNPKIIKRGPRPEFKALFVNSADRPV